MDEYLNNDVDSRNYRYLNSAIHSTYSVCVTVKSCGYERKYSATNVRISVHKPYLGLVYSLVLIEGFFRFVCVSCERPIIDSCLEKRVFPSLPLIQNFILRKSHDFNL